MEQEGDQALPSRAAAMARSLEAAARTTGLDAAAVARLGLAYRLGMAPRVTRLDDDHHPAYLHPGRSALVLLRDVGPRAHEALEVAAILESEDPDLRVGPDVVRRALGDAVAGAVESVPVSSDPRLLERLVALDEPTALAALAERLDHLRHLHLRPELRAVWANRHTHVVEGWLPFATRTDAVLARRFAHWARTFGRRLSAP